MKNIFLLIFLLIFLYIICNRCIEKFSVGGSDINISENLTLSYIDKCNPDAPASCPEGQKKFSANGPCEYQCRCNENYPFHHICKLEFENNCNLAKKIKDCSKVSIYCKWSD